MGEAALNLPLMTEAEYLKFEDSAEGKHEFWYGQLVSMAGAEPSHGTLCHQISRALNNALDDTPCQATGGDQRVKFESDRNYVYPDVVVWCEDSEFDDHHLQALLTPMVIFEVLSPSTANHDRTLKRDAYLTMPSLSDYLLVSVDRVYIEHYSRREDRSWHLNSYVQRAQTIRLNRLGIEIFVADCYRRLDVPEGLRLVQDETI